MTSHWRESSKLTYNTEIGRFFPQSYLTPQFQYGATMNLLCFALAWWLGLYLLGRTGAQRSVRLAGVALALYGAGMAIEALLPFVADASLAITMMWGRSLVLVGAGLVWLGVVRESLLVMQAAERGQRLLWGISLIFLALEVVALLIPVLPFPKEWLYWALGFDLLLLGWLILGWDAFEQGETVLPHAIRSFDGAALGAIVLGAQVAVAASVGDGWTFPMMMLLYGVVATVIGAVTLGGVLQEGLDYLAFGRFPRIREARAALRATADELPRTVALHPLAEMHEAELVRQTRRALRTFGDVAQLATNPLRELPTVTAYLHTHQMGTTDLERARALQHHLRATVEQLKPEEGFFGTTPAWRHYNALYFPYIIGLKPYTVKMTVEEIDPAYRQVWQWLREQVPERTLHHWQSAATKIVAGVFYEELKSFKSHSTTEIGRVLQENG